MRYAIYARVSTKDKGQDPANQILILTEWCQSQGGTFRTYVDFESGGTSQRPAFRRLFEDAAKHRFDCVLVWALDRFSREGMRATVFHLQRLEQMGISIRSHTEPSLSTDNELTRDITLGIFATIAAQERRRISERTLAGLQRARMSGKRLGRPAPEVKAAVRASQASYRAIGQAYGLSLGAISKIKAGA